MLSNEELLEILKNEEILDQLHSIIHSLPDYKNAIAADTLLLTALISDQTSLSSYFYDALREYYNLMALIERKLNETDKDHEAVIQSIFKTCYYNIDLIEFKQNGTSYVIHPETLWHRRGKNLILMDADEFATINFEKNKSKFVCCSRKNGM